MYVFASCVCLIFKKVQAATELLGIEPGTLEEHSVPVIAEPSAQHLNASILQDNNEPPLT